MKIVNGKIVETTEGELFTYYLERDIDDIMSFADYLDAFKRNGCNVILGR
jgi:hypothetical protein